MTALATNQSGGPLTSKKDKDAFKRAVGHYQSLRKLVLEDSKKDEFGNALVHPSLIQSLLNARAKLVKASRRSGEPEPKEE